MPWERICKYLSDERCEAIRKNSTDAEEVLISALPPEIVTAFCTRKNDDIPWNQIRCLGYTSPDQKDAFWKGKIHGFAEPPVDKKYLIDIERECEWYRVKFDNFPQEEIYPEIDISRDLVDEFLKSQYSKPQRRRQGRGREFMEEKDDGEDDEAEKRLSLICNERGSESESESESVTETDEDELGKTGESTKKQPSVEIQGRTAVKTSTSKSEKKREAKQQQIQKTRKRNRQGEKKRKNKPNKRGRAEMERYNDDDDPRKAEERSSVMRDFEDVKSYGTFCLLEGPECRTLKLIREWKMLPVRIDIPNCVPETCDKIEAFVKADPRLRDRVFVYRMTDSEFFKQHRATVYDGIWEDRCSSVLAKDSNWHDLVCGLVNRGRLHHGGILALSFSLRNPEGNVGGEDDTTKNRMISMMEKILRRQNGFYVENEWRKYATFGPAEPRSYRNAMFSMRWKMWQVPGHLLC